MLRKVAVTFAFVALLAAAQANAAAGTDTDVMANTYILLSVAALVVLLLVFALLRRNRKVEDEEPTLPGAADTTNINVDDATAIDDDVTPIDTPAEQVDESASKDEYDDLQFPGTEVSDEDLAAELEEEELSFLSGTDEAATKLDLARAYIEMGDQEGAREILAEVVTEGSAAQIVDARTLLSRL